ncbi:hypothetical protein JCM21714_2626 [Gracilibacillus boraciitolerans JCM 21714]|uniref:5,10-methylene-tetrahydrofolate dehydrogenase n=1 Tax=Gracilibacillus boraciitolerans JCM 21714 TaxID=1298598 RepID=W4VL91_9BACI|nr:hypothetical protein [Gracilibacillus boraciitolerans]GAE93539.1 hypothetical protein JCM21714_2626 [Gracilibacillus boraciitolerans JCM 21714]
MLNKYIDSNYQWDIEYFGHPLTGITENSKEVMEALYEKKEEKEWDFAVCLTDLPLFKNHSLIVAEANEEKRVSLISLPGLGAFPLIKRIKESILLLVQEMNVEKSKNEDLMSSDKNHHFMRKLKFNQLSPILKDISDEKDSNFGVRYTVKSRLRGGIRMITGMVRANRPWLLFPSFIKILIVAFTTGVYALVFPTLWKLSHSYEAMRMVLVSVIAISLLVFWIIMSHSLWEKRDNRYSNYLRKLYNGTTILTLLTTVVLYYFILFVFFIAAVFLLIPMDMLESQINKPIGYSSYFQLAWMATSVSTFIGGALGSSLENEEVVLSGTYGYRQRQRYELVREAQEEKKEATQEKKEAAEKKKEAADRKQEAAEEKEAQV